MASLTSMMYLMVLDELDGDGATFRHRPLDRLSTPPADEDLPVITIPRAEWEQMGRPGEAWITVQPTGRVVNVTWPPPLEPDPDAFEG